MVQFILVIEMNKLEQYIINNHNKIIAIDGPSGAGKSTLSKYLEEKYNVLVFHTDDYFLRPDMKTQIRLDEPGGNIDYKRMEEEIFRHLHDDEITSNSFNCKTNELEIGNTTKSKPIIIIEGVYSLHPKFVSYYDYKVFIDIDRKLQLKRILERSGAFMLKRFKEEWIPLEDRYFDFYDVRKNVDLYINY
jgi:uridine kinase